MSFIVVDVEADGPVPPRYSMVSFGAIIVNDNLDQTFYGQCQPISGDWLPDSLAISGHSRQEHMNFPYPNQVMRDFATWISNNNKGGRPVFISDNLAFDWQWINYYFHTYTGENPFGWSGRRIGDLFCGLKKDAYVKWKHLRKTNHTHHPVDDAKGNAEVILEMKKMGLKINLK